MGEPLILRIDHDDQGSVGSEDTTGFDSDDDMPPVEAGNSHSHVVMIVMIVKIIIITLMIMTITTITMTKQNQ